MKIRILSLLVLSLGVACGGGGNSQDVPDGGQGTSVDDAASPLPDSAAQLGEVTDLVAVQSAATPTTIEVTWTAAPGASSYLISAVTGDAAPSSCDVSESIEVSETQYESSGWALGSNVSFRVCAIADSNVSNGLDATLYVHSGMPPEPTDFQTSNVGATSATVSWNNTGGTTASFRLAYQAESPPSSCNDGTVVNVSGATMAELSGLNAGMTYGVRVCALNGDSMPQISQGPTHVFTTALAPIPEVSVLSCTNTANDPRVHWTGGTTQYFFLTRTEGSEAAACDALGTQLIDGAIGANSRLVPGELGGRYVVWVCGVDGTHPDQHTVGKRILVQMPAIAGNMLTPGSCTPIDT